MVHKFENPSDEINLNTLAIIFFLGLLILFGIYFAFYDPEKYMYRPIRYVQHLVGYVQPSVEHSVGYVQHSVKNSLVGCVQRSGGYVQRSVKYA